LIDAGGRGIGKDGGALSALLGGVAIPVSATGVLAVDLDALSRNYAKLRSLASPAQCAAVVKGDGYGLGATQVAARLFADGCRTFFVATPGEAEALRHGLPDVPIYVLDGLLPGSAGHLRSLGLRPVLGSIAEIEEWSSQCSAVGERLAAAIHIDTGMNRLGLKADEQRHLLSHPDLLCGFEPSLIMSHLACGDTPDHAKNAAQRTVFADFCAQFPRLPMSLANSAGVLLGPEFHFDLVRPGIGLYGGNPFATRPNPMEPVARLYGRILQVGEANAGETVGYGANLTLTRPTRYATISVGYADGYIRALSATDARRGAIAYLDAQPLPMLGRVSMDLIVFDVTDLPPGSAVRGGFIELIGPNFTVDDAGALAGTIGYEILTSLGPRYTRIYVGADGSPAKGGANG
jgi:alanine racemase